MHCSSRPRRRHIIEQPVLGVPLQSWRSLKQVPVPAVIWGSERPTPAVRAPTPPAPVQVAKYCKKLGRTQYEQVPALVAELRAQPPPPGVTLSESGLSLRLHFADAADLARRLNPGFVEGGYGGAADAVAVVIDRGISRPSTLSALMVPADPSYAPPFPLLVSPERTQPPVLQA